jgi:hypothetical protein
MHVAHGSTLPFRDGAGALGCPTVRASKDIEGVTTPSANWPNDYEIHIGRVPSGIVAADSDLVALILQIHTRGTGS